MKTSHKLGLCLLLLAQFPQLQAQSGNGPTILKNAVSVRTAPVETEQLSDRIEALGTAKAWEFVSIRSSETERITHIAFESGQQVKAGDILVELSHAEEKADLAGARATLTRHERDLQRLHKLVDSNLATREQLDSTETLVTETRALIDALEARIADRVIRAPFSGQLGLRNISLGSMVSPTAEITTLQDISRLKLDFTLPERLLPLLEGGMPIQALSQAHAGREFQGQVMIAEARVDPQTRTFIVRAQLDNRDGLLKPGMLLTVEIISNPRKSLTIPEAALVPLAERQSVFVLEPSAQGFVARRRDIELGRRYQGKVEVVSGLKTGQQVVTRGTMHIQDGQAVIPEPSAKPQPADMGQL